MLVQPVVAPIASGETTTSSTTWLPPGRWVTWSGQQEHSGGADVTAAYTIREIPMFVRAGAVVPMRDASSLTQTTAFSDPLIWAVWPGSASGGNSSVIEDDGATLRFEEGALATTKMHWSVSGSAGIAITVEAPEGDFGVECSAEEGFEYAGPGADLQDIGVVASAAKCCDACATYSNCAFWTFAKESSHCVLKVSRRGRRANSSAVSGVAPRRMPTSRAHHFQLRSSRFAKTPPSSVTVNGKALPKIAPGASGSGWFVQGATESLSEAEGSLVIRTPSAALSQRLEVLVGQ